MAIRIERIKINRNGPLNEDFVLTPGAVNLVYGPNETGKTYIVESLINLLFRTGKKAAVQWVLRGWDFSGTINVSGFGEKPVSFTRTSKKLEDYWEQDTGLPRDFSRLMVVKAGQTLLMDEAADGIGRDILKNYLSGEGLLDDIEKDIPVNVRNADVINGDIPGPQQGEVKKRREITQELKRVEALLAEAEKAYASAEMDFLRRKQYDLTGQLERLSEAKRYHAAHIFKGKESLRRELEGLPGEEELYGMLAAIDNHEKSRSAIERKTAELEGMAGIEDDYRWIEKALELYREFSARAVQPPGFIYMILLAIVLAGTGVAGYLNRTIPFLAGIALLVILLVIYFLGMRRVLSTKGDNLELRKLKEEYKARFKQELTDLAVLEVRRDSLRNDNFKAGTIREELDKLIPALQANESDLHRKVKTMTGLDLSSHEWRLSIMKVKDRRKKLIDDVVALEGQLRLLTVREEDYSEQDPGIAWNSGTYDELFQDYEETVKLLKAELDGLDNLRGRVAHEIGLESRDWEELLHALEEKRERIVLDYKQKTAQILAGKQVFEVIQEYRAQENARIEQGLQRGELTLPLHAVTGRYRSVRHDAEKGLMLTTDEDSEYSLSGLSTGAREQVFLALRMGFAAIAMQGQPAFLILDDAFQHSDWLRRENLVDQVIGLEKSGWQIFYFTMDDHIRDLFLNTGQKLGETFTHTELRR